MATVTHTPSVPGARGVFNEILNFGRDAAETFFNFKGHETETEMARELRRAEEAKLSRLEKEKKGERVITNELSSAKFSLQKNWQFLAIAGAVLVGVAVLKK